jgi:hypothetical protein
MSVFHRLEEEGGHELTLFSGLHMGRSNYVCEKCGTIVIVGNNEVVLFHAPPGNASTETMCVRRYVTEIPKPTLKEKLKAIEDADWERLRENV